MPTYVYIYIEFELVELLNINCIAGKSAASQLGWFACPGTMALVVKKLDDGTWQVCSPLRFKMSVPRLISQASNV